MAGASQHARVEETDPHVVEALWAVNTMGAMHVARAGLPGMLERQRGRFVIISSMAACIPSPGQSAYACCKAGLNAYFETLATELSTRRAGPHLVRTPVHTEGARKKVDQDSAACRHGHKHNANRHRSRVHLYPAAASCSRSCVCQLYKLIGHCTMLHHE